MLTKEVQRAENDCKPLHPSEINIYDVCAQCEQIILLKWCKKFNSDTSTKTEKCTVHFHTSVGLWDMWVQGQRVGVLVATCICITYNHTNTVAHNVETWAGEGENPWPPDLLFLWPGVTFGIFIARLAIAVHYYKMALPDSFTGIKALSRFLTG